MDFSGSLRFIILLSLVRVGLFIKASDGDDVECVDLTKQPAFHSKLLKNHKFQESPSEIPRTVETGEKNTLQTWEARVSTANCPEGTVPIRIYNVGPLNGGRASDTTSYTPGHEYAVIQETPRNYLYGAKATINVWDPEIEGDEMSISQIWIGSGNYKTDNLNTIEVGWQVLPRLYLDNKPRLFIFWTSESYRDGCYNLRCSGFIQTSSSIVLGGSITPVSSFGGSQYEITILVWKDGMSGNWWLSLGSKNSVIGYWPRELFTGLADHATQAEWGGEILNSGSHRRHTKTQMGSGHFPGEGFKNSSYFRNIEIVDKNNSLQAVQHYKKLVTHPDCYNIKSGYTDEWKSHFYYGGPGFRSGAVVTTRLFYFLSFSCLVVLNFVL